VVRDPVTSVELKAAGNKHRKNRQNVCV
jgi:hypothetical protein